MKTSWMRSFVAIATVILWMGSGQALASGYEEVIYYHNDALGSPIVATDASGNVKWREEYSPYGSRLLHESREVDGATGAQIESPWDEKQWFTGKLEETGVGIQYYGARWYEPELGRFLSPDPVQFTESNIFSFNRYAYANNNPYKFIDPDGKFPFLVALIFIGKEVVGEVFTHYTGFPAPAIKGFSKKVISEAVEQATKNGIRTTGKNVPKGDPISFTITHPVSMQTALLRMV